MQHTIRDCFKGKIIHGPFFSKRNAVLFCNSATIVLNHKQNKLEINNRAV